MVCGDTNGGWTEDESTRFLAAVVGSPVRFVEQPTMNTDALVRLAEGSSVAICADESARTLDDVAALGKTAVAGVSLKLIKHAGITGVMRGAALCDQVGLEINLAGAQSWGRHTVLTTLRYDATISGQAPVSRLFRMGGFFDISALIDGNCRIGAQRSCTLWTPGRWYLRVGGIHRGHD